jgi:5-methyltetrahydrofolate--homocysteine methyltransferase
LWGYESGAELSREEIIEGKYQGLRMAFGYPACPDHSLKREVFDLLGVEQKSPLRLTENYMINPGESLCGLMFADAEMEYFSVGRISAEQLADYSHRRGLSEEEMAKIIAKNIKR